MAFVTRPEWGADKVSWQPMPTKPVNTIFLHHTATQATGDGAKDMRNIESGEQAVGYSTIAYHEVVHPSGNVYEGRPLTALGAATYKNNSTSMAICLIGNFQNIDPTPEALEAAAQRLAFWVKNGFATKNFNLRSHSEVFATACCGSRLKPKIPWIRNRVTEILNSGGSTSPQPEGVLVAKTLDFESKLKVGTDGNGYVDVYHRQGANPTSVSVEANGGISGGKYPNYSPQFWVSRLDGQYVRVTSVKNQSNAEFTILVSMNFA